jgi:hypothetical protein
MTFQNQHLEKKLYEIYLSIINSVLLFLIPAKQCCLSLQFQLKYIMSQGTSFNIVFDSRLDA